MLDAAGNRTAKQDDLAGVTSNYTYDAIYELTQVMQGTTTDLPGSTSRRPGSPSWESYSYDAVGNRLSSLGVSRYSYNTSNELTSTASGSYTYDANGNTLTDASGRSYTWDFENRLTQVTMPSSGGTATFKYDPFGRRIQKVFTQNSATTTTNYLYDGDNAIQTVDQNGNVLSKFAQGQSIDEPLAESVGGATYDYEQDGLGSATSLTNSSGALALTYTYDSFGKVTNTQGSVSNPFRYTGRDFDSETGLYYYRARYYDAGTGRFVSEDPTGFLAGIDFYNYVDDHPTDVIDPTGLLQVCCRSAHLPFVTSYAKKTLQPLPCHCFLKLADGHTLGGYYSGPPLFGGSLGALVLRKDDIMDDKVYSKEAKCSDVPGGYCRTDGAVKRVFDSYNNSNRVMGGYGFASGDVGVSNDAAADLLRQAGIGYTLPGCTWGKNAGWYPLVPGLTLPLPVRPIIP